MLSNARTRAKRAEAHFQLALFHDNNSREAVAIPHYRAGLRAGLKGEQHAQALAWLASSLYKTGQTRRAMRFAGQAAKATSDKDLLKFLGGLRLRIDRRRKRNGA